MGSLMYKKPDRMFVYYHLQRNREEVRELLRATTLTLPHAHYLLILLAGAAPGLAKP